MDLQVHSIHFDADTKLIDFIHGKVKKLDLFFDQHCGRGSVFETG